MLVWSAADHKLKLPLPICERLKAHSAGDGRLQVSGWHRGRVAVALETKEFGVQTAEFDIRPHDDTPIVVTLRSTQPFEGRVVPPEGAKADLSTLQVVLRQSSLSPAVSCSGQKTLRRINRRHSGWSGSMNMWCWPDQGRTF